MKIILVSDSVFNLLQYAAMVEAYLENPDSHRHVVRKGGHFFVVILGNFEYSFLILC